MTCDRRAMVPAIPRPYKEREDALDLVQFAHIALQSSPFNTTSPAVALLKDVFVVTFLFPMFLIFDSTSFIIKNKWDRLLNNVSECTVANK